MTLAKAHWLHSLTFVMVIKVKSMAKSSNWAMFTYNTINVDWIQSVTLVEIHWIAFTDLGQGYEGEGHSQTFLC